jgi:hypothetical protein
MGTHSSLFILPRICGAAVLLALAGCGEGVVTPDDGDIARLEAVTGSGQRATVGEPVPKPLVVRAVSRGGHPVTGVAIAFRFINTDGRVAPGVTTTGPDGQATAQVTLGGSVGDQVVEARLVDENGLAVEFQLTGLERQDPGGGGGGAGGGAGGGGDDGNGGHGGTGGDSGNGGNGHGGNDPGGGGSVGGDDGGGGSGTGGGGENGGGSGGGGGAGDDGGHDGGGDGGHGNGGDDNGGHGHDGGHHGGND